ncbi:ABC transporter ATP-binding protein [Elioraea sp. Yellowstone]|uniref:ABC transporter ATP-binding protein n=1 Tax=Elioraea sp. Yellowstone TaxID=2592070 RepID=UPI0013873CFD|nr:ATP-binding cassette domain-containing protein [Elioraea sp. Yellowstone]
MSVREGPVFSLRNVRRTREGGGRRFVLEVPALEIAPGARLALLGPSGSGKSTLLDLLALVLRPDPGSERFLFAAGAAPLDVAAAWQGDETPLATARAAHLGYVLQTGGLLPFLTVRANIALPARLAGREDRARVEELALRLGVASVLDSPAEAISVGQRQRAAIARALVHRPAVVLADEPTAAVDPAMAVEVMALLLAETEAAGAALVLATHDHAMVARLDLPVARFAVADRDGAAVAVVGA